MDVGDVPWNALYSAEFIKKNNLRYNNLRCANDSSFYIACLANADRIMVCEEYLVYHRTNVAGSLVSVRYRFFENQIQSYDTICDIVNKSTVSDDVKKYVICSELIRTFLWYEKLISKKVNAFGVVDVTTRFVRDYNPEVLGKKYWNVFKNTHYIYYYNKLKKRAEINFVHEKTENPEISVIIPVDKTSIHIAECMDSVAEDFALALQRAQEKVCGTEHSGCRYKSYADMAVCYMTDMLKNAVRAETLEKIYCSLPEYLRILGIGTDNIGTFGIKGEGGYIAAVIKYKSFEDYLFEEVKNFRTFEDEKITRYKGVISRGKKARSKFNTVTYSVKSAVSAMKGCYRDYGFMYTVNLMIKKLKKQK